MRNHLFRFTVSVIVCDEHLNYQNMQKLHRIEWVGIIYGVGCLLKLENRNV